MTASQDNCPISNDNPGKPGAHVWVRSMAGNYCCTKCAAVAKAGR